jgi:hypothetical protein
MFKDDSLVPPGDLNIIPKWGCLFESKKSNLLLMNFCAPTGIRTPVVALKGLRPSPLDDGGMDL